MEYRHRMAWKWYICRRYLFKTIEMIKYLHSAWGLFTVLLMIFVVIHHVRGLWGRKPYGLRSDFRLALFALVVFGIQFLLGLLNFFTSEYFQGIREGHTGEYMKNAHTRLLIVEHPTMSLIALLLMLYGFRRMYYQVDPRRKYWSIALFYALALLALAVRLPWFSG